MEALLFFKDVDTDVTTRTEFIKSYHNYNAKYNTIQLLKFQMKDITCLEFHINLFKIFCSDHKLNQYHQHIIINHAGFMSSIIRTHYLSESTVDVELRRVFVSFLRYIHEIIVRHPSEQEYWFRVVFNATLTERNIGLAILYLQLLDDIFNDSSSVHAKIACVTRTVSRNTIERKYDDIDSDCVPNLIDYAISMYPQHHSISWPMFSDQILKLMQNGGVYLHRRHVSGEPYVKFDSKVIQLCFYFLNNDDNQDIYNELLELLNDILITNCFYYDIKLFTELFTSHNLYTLASLPTLFQNEAKEAIQYEVLRLFNYIFSNVEVDVPKCVIEYIYNTIEVYDDIDCALTVYHFLTLTHQTYPELDFNLKQIKYTLEYIESTDIDEQDLIQLSCVFLLYLHDLFVECPPPPSICELGFQKDVFKALVHNYQFLTMSTSSRGLLANIVYEFMKIGNGHPELNYAAILVDSGYLDMVHEDDNVYNLTILNKIENNYIRTSLVDKCLMTIDKHTDLYDQEHVDDALEIINSQN